MKNKVLKTIKKYNLIENGDKLVLGVSGGPDSIAMLNILNDLRIEKDIELDFNIVVAHINHMIRDEAIEDENFVKKFCEEKGIEFYSKSIDVKKAGKFPRFLQLNQTLRPGSAISWSGASRYRPGWRHSP